MFKKYLKVYLLFNLLGLTLAFHSKKDIIFILIITAIYFLTTLIYRLINKNKYEVTIPRNNQSIAINISIIMSLVVFIISFIYNRASLPLKINLIESFYLFIINILLTYPINPTKYTTDKDIYNISCTRTIISEEIPSIQELSILKDAGINIILFNKKELPSNISKSFKEIDIKDLDYKQKKNNLHIKTFTKKDINKNNNHSTYLYVEKDLTKNINNIFRCRGIIDNLIRTININAILSYSLSALIIIPLILGFPQIFNNNLIIITCLLFHVLNTYLIPHIESDYDVIRRQPRNLNDKLFTPQELVLIVLEIIGIIIGVSLIYMSTLTAESTYKLASTIAFNIYLFCYLFIILIHLSESLTIINLFKIFRNIYSLLTILIIILFTILIWYIPNLELKLLGIINYRSTIIMAIIATIWFDITKLARYLKTRKKVQNA